MIEHIGHTDDCAIREDGPCTCGTDEVLEELALEEVLEEVGFTNEDFA